MDRAEEVLKEIMSENFPSLTKDINLQIQESEGNLNGVNPNGVKPMIRHIIIKLLQTRDQKKKRNLESSQREIMHHV